MSPEERLAVLEERANTQEELLKTINTNVDTIKGQLASQKGFFGGIVFAVSAIWVVGLAAFSYFKGH